MPACLAYVEKQIKDAGITQEQFLGKAGDVFLWQGQLLHGGAQIKDAALTRKTLVTHYWRVQDVPSDRVIRVHDTGFYEKRAHQPVVTPGSRRHVDERPLFALVLPERQQLKGCAARR